MSGMTDAQHADTLDQISRVLLSLPMVGKLKAAKSLQLAAARLRGDGEHGQAVAPFAHLLLDRDGECVETRMFEPDAFWTYTPAEIRDANECNPDRAPFTARLVYDRPQPVAGDADLREWIGFLVSMAAITDEDAARHYAEMIDAALSTQPAPSAPEVDYTAEEVDDVIDAATQRGTRHVPIECIEQMRKVLHAALSAPSEQVAASVAVPEGWRCGFCERTYKLDNLCCPQQRAYRQSAAAPVAPEREG